MTDYAPALCGRCGIARENAGNPLSCGEKNYLEVGCLLAWWEMRVGQTFVVYARSADDALEELVKAEQRPLEAENASLVDSRGVLAPYATHMPGSRAEALSASALPAVPVPEEQP